MKSMKTVWDVLVVGGGPAGMMAAITAQSEGASVLLVEKNAVLGKKLRITGGGRCNITNEIFDHRKLSECYGVRGKALLSPFARFGVAETISFFKDAGVPTETQAEGRVFPQSNSAPEVTNALIKLLRTRGVATQTNTTVQEFIEENGALRGILTNRGEIYAKTIILATGGTARPETGSTGEAFQWLKRLGHTIHAPSTALVPVVIQEPWIKRLQGVALAGIKLSIIQQSKTTADGTGKILFTHFGISGPLALTLSRKIGESLSEGDVLLALDLFPTLDHQALDAKLLEHFTSVQNKEWRNALKGFLPNAAAPVIAELSGIPLDRFVNKVSRSERLALGKLLKRLTITPVRLLGTEKAISSSGGVDIREVDFKTMRSRKISNLYLVGDVLDFDRPSGGFSLQICWSTGFIAGQNAAH